MFQEVIRSRRNSAVSIKETTLPPSEEEVEADGKNGPSKSLLETKFSDATTTQASSTLGETNVTKVASPEPSTTTCAQCIIL